MKPNWPNRFMGIFALMVFLTSFILFIWGKNGLIEQNKLLTQLDSLQQVKITLNHENTHLQEKIQNLLHDPHYLKEEAHKLLLTEKDYVLIRFLQPNKK